MSEGMWYVVVWLTKHVIKDGPCQDCICFTWMSHQLHKSHSKCIYIYSSLCIYKLITEDCPSSYPNSAWATGSVAREISNDLPIDFCSLPKTIDSSKKMNPIYTSNSLKNSLKKAKRFWPSINKFFKNFLNPISPKRPQILTKRPAWVHHVYMEILPFLYHV